MTETPTTRLRVFGRKVLHGIGFAGAAVGVPFFISPDFRTAVFGSLLLLAVSVGMTDYTGKEEA